MSEISAEQRYLVSPALLDALDCIVAGESSEGVIVTPQEARAITVCLQQRDEIARERDGLRSDLGAVNKYHRFELARALAAEARCEKLAELVLLYVDPCDVRPEHEELVTSVAKALTDQPKGGEVEKS